MHYPKLYCRDSNGGTRVWWIEREGASYRQNYGVLGGKIVTTNWLHSTPKNEGKSNETTPEEQAHKECEAEIKLQLRLNYFENVDDIDKGFLEPQLAKPTKGTNYIDKIKWEDGQIVDHKLNGVACIVKNGGAFSRKNKQFHAIPHIVDELAFVFEEFPNAYLQGELFNPKYVTELNKIAELVAVTRQPKDLTPELLAESKRMVEYVLYDGHGFSHDCHADSNGATRREELRKFIESHNFKHIKLVNYKICKSLAEMQDYFAEYVATGGEGVIIRDPTAPYHHKRTKALLKFKKSESAEFKVISIEAGEGNWTGCAKFVWLELPNGLKSKKFKSNVSGSQEHLGEVLKNKESYVGKTVIVEFQEYSPYRCPLVPYTSLVVRDYE